MVEQHASAIQHFSSSILLNQAPPHELLDMTPDEVKSYLQTTGVKALKGSMGSIKRFVCFLVETGRIEYERSEELRQTLT